MTKVIYAMSRRLRDIGDDLDNIGKPLILHLVKVVLYSDHASLNHWIDEIYGFLHTIDTYKGRNKAPSSKFIFDNLYAKNNSKYLDRWINVVKEDYGNSDVSNYEVRKFVENYLTWISDELSTHLAVSKSAVRHKLFELFHM